MRSVALKKTRSTLCSDVEPAIPTPALYTAGNDHDAAPAPAPDPALSLLQREVHPPRAIMRTLNGKRRLDPLAAAANAADGAAALETLPLPLLLPL